jgi:hypothetical protein
MLFGYEVPLFLAVLSPAIMAGSWRLAEIAEFFQHRPLLILPNIIGFIVNFHPVDEFFSQNLEVGPYRSLKIFFLVMNILGLILVAGGWSVPATGHGTVAAFPMAVPLLVGPGAITTTIVSLQTRGITLTFSSVLVVFLLVSVILSVGDHIHRILGEAGATVISGVMMIITAAIAVGFISKGIRNLI